MSDKINLMKAASKKASTDSSLLAYFLNKYLLIEKTTESAILKTLNCSVESYYKLSLCRVPDPNSEDYLKKLNIISNYIGISSIELNKIIKRVHTVLQFSDTLANKQSFLMAARDKKKKDT